MSKTIRINRGNETREIEWGVPPATGEIVRAEPIQLAPAHQTQLGAALQAQDGAQERTNGVDRSKALIMRMLPFTALWMVLAVAVGVALQAGAAFTFLMFAALTVATYAYMDRTEYQFSRNGVERHKINTLAKLKQAEMRHEHELRRMALRAHLHALGIDDDD